MNKSTVHGLTAVMAIFVIVQIADAQMNSPQPNRQSANVMTSRPRRQIRQRQQQVPVVQRTRLAPARAQPMSYAAALQRFHHQRHTQFWWRRHFEIIVLSVGGYYYLDSGYWYPCWGFDPNYEAYDYDGPIFTYGNLLPDEVILNVQRALTDLGYYGGSLSGSLSPATRYAISAYQRDNGLFVNGVVDGALVYSLGLD